MVVWLNRRANGRWFPPINTRGGGANENTLHTTHFTLLLSPHLRCRVVLGSLGVEILRRGAGNGALLQFVPIHESEEESGDVPGLSVLFSACTSTDAYSVVSVRDFLCLFI